MNELAVRARGLEKSNGSDLKPCGEIGAFD